MGFTRYSEMILFARDSQILIIIKELELHLFSVFLLDIPRGYSVLSHCKKVYLCVSNSFIPIHKDIDLFWTQAMITSIHLDIFFYHSAKKVLFLT